MKRTRMAAVTSTMLPAAARLCVLAIAGLVLAWPAGFAAADTFPGNYDHRVADDAIHTYCLTSSFALEDHKQVAEYAMYYLDETTDMSDSVQGCLSYTDVWWYDVDLSGTLRGQRVCAKVGDIPSVCDRSNVSLDFPQLDIGTNDWEDRRKTSCHELGHSVGLDHDTVSCMITGEVPSTALQWRRYSTHDVGHINTQY